MSAPSLLAARGLSKSYGPVRALCEVDLDLAAGEVVALVGENGSGKSTLSRLLTGGAAPDAGTVLLRGAPVRFARPREALAAGVAVVSQEPAAVPGMSVAENVLLTRLSSPARRTRRRAGEREAAGLLQRVGLDLDPAQPLASVGQGERELVELAKALAAAPRVLVLDEVTTRMPDPERLFQVVEQLSADGVGVLFITHRLREIRRLASRAVVLRDGRLVARLSRDELSDETISAAMVGRELGDFYGKVHVEPGPTVLEVAGVPLRRAGAPVSLSVRAGEVVGVAGLVGSGRSALLEMLAGCRTATAGTVCVAGRVVRPGAPAAARAAGVGLVPEDRFRQGLLRPASISANLALDTHAVLRRPSRRREQQQARASIDRYRIRCSSPDAPVTSLSGGNAQKIVLARCLAARPRVLLLDEPTRGVDVGARAEIYEMVMEQVQGGSAVLLASSDLLELLALCDRVLVLHDGELVGELTGDEATEEELALLSAGGRRAA